MVLPENTFNLDKQTVRADLVKNGLEIPLATPYTIYISENPTTGYSWHITDESR